MSRPEPFLRENNFFIFVCMEFIFHYHAQSRALYRSLFNSSAVFLSSLATEKREVSSAKIFTSQGRTRDPRPGLASLQQIGAHCEHLPFNTTRCLRFSKKLLSNDKRCPACKVSHHTKLYLKPMKDRGRRPVLLCWGFLQKQHKFYELLPTIGSSNHRGRSRIDVELRDHFFKSVHL